MPCKMSPYHAMILLYLSFRLLFNASKLNLNAMWTKICCQFSLPENSEMNLLITEISLLLCFWHMGSFMIKKVSSTSNILDTLSLTCHNEWLQIKPRSLVEHAIACLQIPQCVALTDDEPVDYKYLNCICPEEPYAMAVATRELNTQLYFKNTELPMPGKTIKKPRRIWHANTLYGDLIIHLPNLKKYWYRTW